MTSKKPNLAAASKRTSPSSRITPEDAMKVLKAIEAIKQRGPLLEARSKLAEQMLLLAQHVQISPSEALRLVDPDGVNQVAPDLEKAANVVAVYRAQVASKTLTAIEWIARRRTKPLSENS
jgi:hypothetical protein